MSLSAKTILISLLFLLGKSAAIQANTGLINAPHSPPSTGQFRIHGLNHFTGIQKELLRAWLNEGVSATRLTLGDYPRRLELYVYPRLSNQPVPWAHTRRDAQESVHFYVDTQFPLSQFVEDWTIYHELAHLAIPYVGEEFSWFSEGFASYMQYQIMAKKQRLSRSLTQAYNIKIAPHLALFNVDDSAAVVARRLMEKRNFPAAYWGACYYFVLADKQLQNKHNIQLTQLIAYYQEVSRQQDKNIHQLVTSLDAIIEDSLFSDLLHRFEYSPAKNLYPTHLN